MLTILVAILGVLLLACILALWGLARIDTAASFALTRMQDAMNSQGIITCTLKSYQNQADTIINGQSDEMEFAANFKAAEDAVKTFGEIADTPEEKAGVTKMLSSFQLYRQNFIQEILPRVKRELAEKEPTEKQKIRDEIRAADDKTDGILTEIFKNAQMATASLVKEAQAEQINHRAAAKMVKQGMMALTLVAIVGGLILGMAMVRGIARDVREVSDHLATGARQTTDAANQVSTASQSLAEGASEQAASLEETSSSLEELSSMTAQNADHARQAKELANATRLAADAGAQKVAHMNTAMGAIQTSSSEIANIIKTIDEIAFQTNILALNAAVEAARAGSAGMGFAVVAEEVRNLAQRSAQAAKETAAKIESAVASSTQGVAISGEVGKVLEDIATKARQVDDLVAEVAVASQEQNQGITQLNTAVSQMDKVTQANAASAEESASAAEELKAQARSMEDAVRHLQVLTGARAQATTEPANKPAANQSKLQAVPKPQPKPNPKTKHPSETIRRNAPPAADADFKDF